MPKRRSERLRGAVLVGGMLGLLLVAGTGFADTQKAVEEIWPESLTPGELHVEWTVPEHAPNDYRVNWGPAGERFPSWREETGNDFPTDNALTLHDLEPGVLYQVRVRARYGEGNPAGLFSAAVTQLVDDYHDDLDTEGSVAVEGSQAGDIGSPADVDWHAVTLDADRGYDVRVTGDEALGVLLAGIYDEAGTVVSSGLAWSGMAKVSFRPPAAGTYFVSVAGSGKETGSYELEVLQGAVTGLSLASESAGALTISWEAAYPAPDDYWVRWAKADKDFPSETATDGNAYVVGTS